MNFYNEMKMNCKYGIKINLKICFEIHLKWNLIN